MHHIPYGRRQVERKSARPVERMQCQLINIKFDDTGTDTKRMAFEGYGAVFGNVDSYGDVIAKGAFTRTIRDAKSSGQWPAMLLQHGGWAVSADDLMPVGVWEDLEEDDVGLFSKGVLAPTVRGIEAHTLMKMEPRPAINGLSIGYVPIKWKMRGAPDEPRRTLEEVKLVEISLVTFPANTKARVQSVKGQHGIRLAEQALRDAGFSAAEAKAIVAGGFKNGPTALRDAGDMQALSMMVNDLVSRIQP